MGSIANNPYVKPILDNLEYQFGKVAYLSIDEFCSVVKIERARATHYIHQNGIPFEMPSSRRMIIPVLELALYLARKKAASEGNVIFTPMDKNYAKNNRGFSQQAHLKQLLGG